MLDGHRLYHFILQYNTDVYMYIYNKVVVGCSGWVAYLSFCLPSVRGKDSDPVQTSQVPAGLRLLTSRPDLPRAHLHRHPDHCHGSHVGRQEH